jgi:hypothetical protein
MPDFNSDARMALFQPGLTFGTILFIMIVREFMDWGIEGFEDCDRKSPNKQELHVLPKFRNSL